MAYLICNKICFYWKQILIRLSNLIIIQKLLSWVWLFCFFRSIVDPVKSQQLQNSSRQASTRQQQPTARLTANNPLPAANQQRPAANQFNGFPFATFNRFPIRRWGWMKTFVCGYSIFNNLHLLVWIYLEWPWIDWLIKVQVISTK